MILLTVEIHEQIAAFARWASAVEIVEESTGFLRHAMAKITLAYTSSKHKKNVQN